MNMKKTAVALLIITAALVPYRVAQAEVNFSFGIFAPLPYFYSHSYWPAYSHFGFSFAPYYTHYTPSHYYRPVVPYFYSHYYYPYYRYYSHYWRPYYYPYYGRRDYSHNHHDYRRYRDRDDHRNDNHRQNHSGHGRYDYDRRSHRDGRDTRAEQHDYQHGDSRPDRGGYSTYDSRKIRGQHIYEYNSGRTAQNNQIAERLARKNSSINNTYRESLSVRRNEQHGRDTTSMTPSGRDYSSSHRPDTGRLRQNNTNNDASREAGKPQRDDSRPTRQTENRRYDRERARNEGPRVALASQNESANNKGFRSSGHDNEASSDRPHRRDARSSSSYGRRDSGRDYGYNWRGR